MATSTDSLPARRGTWPLRFSLRFLLLAVTVFAMGFPICYRWPYAETTWLDLNDPFDPTAGVKRERGIVTTWRRQWGGTRVKQGPERTYVTDRLCSEVFYRDGVLEGPARYFDAAGGLRERGQYHQGKKHGLWTTCADDGNEIARFSFTEGVVDGVCSLMHRDGLTNLWSFNRGRVTGMNGQPIESRLSALLASPSNGGPELATALNGPAEESLAGDYSLVDFAYSLELLHGTPIEIDRHHADANTQIRNHLEGVDLFSLLTVVLAQHDLACDYRYGCLWFTATEDARDWCDPTGVDRIVPPAGSKLAAAWNVPTFLLHDPHSDELARIAAWLEIEIDVAAVVPPALPDDKRFQVASNSRFGLPFKHELGIFLYSARCRCELRGETLVILPAE